jgi:metallo-beta-lactamase class B
MWNLLSEAAAYNNSLEWTVTDRVPQAKRRRAAAQLGRRAQPLTYVSHRLAAAQTARYDSGQCPVPSGTTVLVARPRAYQRRQSGLRILCLATLLGLVVPSSSAAAQSTPTGYTPEECPPCAGWNAPRLPMRLFGNTYWVGTQGLGAVLISSTSGHILIDGGLPESAPLILANIRDLGFAVQDVRVILNSHAHYDHAGGIAELHRATGASVYATSASARALRTGVLTAEDPQRNTALAFPPVPEVGVIADGDTVRVGPVALVAHVTPGHSPGGTTWSWRSCEGDVCLDIVYADSQTPVSDDGFQYSEGDRAVRFESGLDAIETLACDLLLTPHPGASDLWERVAEQDRGDANPLVDSAACARYAAQYRERLTRRLAREIAGR